MSAAASLHSERLVGLVFEHGDDLRSYSSWQAVLAILFFVLYLFSGFYGTFFVHSDYFNRFSTPCTVYGLCSLAWEDSGQ
jgi:hypothetical protein